MSSYQMKNGYQDIFIPPICVCNRALCEACDIVYSCLPHFNLNATIPLNRRERKNVRKRPRYKKGLKSKSEENKIQWLRQAVRK